MSRITFRYLLLREMDSMLPQLFQILYTNMNCIAPTDCNYEEDRQLWLSYIKPALERGETRILLMYAGDHLAGYFQYRIREDTLLADEIEIKPEYQRTMVFYRFCCFMLSQLPEELKYLSSYVHKKNRNSQSIHKSLGMQRIGENRSGTSWYYRGERAALEARLPRK